MDQKEQLDVMGKMYAYGRACETSTRLGCALSALGAGNGLHDVSSLIVKKLNEVEEQKRQIAARLLVHGIFVD